MRLEVLVEAENKREMKTNDTVKRIIHPKVSNNNCFFKCIQCFVPELRENLTRTKCNQIRKHYGVNADQSIDAKTALDIFRHYSQEGKFGLEIWSNDILIGELKGTAETLLLSLEDDHYSLIEIKKYQRCKECGRKYVNKHTCNTNMRVFKKINEGKHRYVINSFKRDKFNFDESNTDVVIVHYDIETHTRSGSGNTKFHVPYIVGYIDNLTHSFQYYAGADCMEQFITRLFQYSNYTKVYVNAYNGSKFDHYEFVKKLNSMHTKDKSAKLDQLVLNNGAILKAEVGNISCFDISKHTTGTLRQNLQELGCAIQKGEFDYNLGDDWHNIAAEDQARCLEYLERDVVGLQELTQLLNKSCFENHGVNLYKFLSTSQLTYATWINFLYSEHYNPVFLHTPDHEKFFRESIYGGRTYKYKHKFLSSQRQAYINKEIKFDDIDDYLVDADVNSLYPAAMKFKYPSGIPHHLKPGTPSVEYFNRLIKSDKKCPKVGIYRVDYVTNKNLIDAILPKREEGRLIWDLKNGEGIYNSIDIDNALKHGYQVVIIEGYYWEETENVFDSYINYLYQFKKKATKGSAQYKLAKLMMNGLYGKTIQRPILDENVIIYLHEEFIKYHIKYGGESMRALSDGSFFLTYQDEEQLISKINKPCYLGSFILGYSRRIMLDYLSKTNPYFDSADINKQTENSPYYTDTDSIQIHQRNLKGIELNNEIEGISDDLGDNCKILYGGWIAPKLYFFEYVEKKDGKEVIKYHLKGKGIPKDQLTIEMFESMMSGKSVNVEMERNFKRINVNRNSKQQNIDNFSILKLESLNKCINSTPWTGRHFIGNNSVPNHHRSAI
jgi:DNA polymerase type B, organellar and viral